MPEYKKIRVKVLRLTNGVVLYSKRAFTSVKKQTRTVLQQIDHAIAGGLLRFFNALGRIKYVRGATAPVYRKVVGPHPRITALLLCGLLVISVVAPVAMEYSKNKRYDLNTYAHTLLGKSNDNLSKKLTYDNKERLFQFNKDAKKDPVTDGNPLEQLQSKVGGAGKDDQQQYSVDVSEDLSKGIAYYDNQMELSFKLVPQFKTMPGQKRDGHLIYPLSGSAKGQVAYTVGAAGLKENVLLYQSPGDYFEMGYSLELPKSLEARLIPETGEVGIYSADPTLFGNISYGSSDDQSKVENARNNSEKTFLTFRIPAPIVMGLSGTDQATTSSVKSKFELQDNVLTVKSTGLDKAQYPLAIDPSVTVDSTSDLQSGNMEDDNGTVDSGTLKRNNLTSGSVGSWTTATNSMPSFAYYHSVAVYNSYMYVVYSSSVWRAPLNTDGSLGSWSSSSFPVSRNSHSVVTYNGYLYVLGGSSGGTTSTVYYAPLNANGTVGTWNTTTSFTGNRERQTSVAYGGYIYVIGGDSGSGTRYNDVQYAPLNANGTVGTWNTTTSFTTGRYGHASAVYNGYVYILGGNNGTSNLNDVQYAPLNANGTVGTWNTTSSFTTARYLHTAAITSGYVYIMGGNTSNLNDVQYAPLNANGTVGTWNTTTSFTTGRYGHASAVYNGYVYILGGTGAANYATVQYAKAGAAGPVSTYAASATTFTNPRNSHASVAYNGYLYVLGGWNGTTYYNNTQYAPINANGSLGAWGLTNNFSGTRYGHTAVAYNGYMYVMGGDLSGTLQGDTQYAPINANGTVGTWNTTLSFGTARKNHASVAYNGYMYVMGGNTGTNQNDTRYAPINANGTVGTWNATVSFTTARRGHVSIAYAGYMYILGGWNGTTFYGDTQYAPINANGTVGTWNTTNSFANGRTGLAAVISNGYIYVMGGNIGTNQSDTQYAPINSNGTLGTWGSTNSFANIRNSHSAVAYNGYIYITGGQDGVISTDSIQYAQINNGGAGSTTAWTAGTSFTTARFRHTSVAYNGYLYVMGGTTNSTTAYNDVQYAQINSNGSLGAWASTTSLPTAVFGHTAVASGGKMYVLGGDKGGATATDFYYTGGTQTYVVPAGVTSIGVTACGAQGGDLATNNSDGGLGGCIQSDLAVTPGETLNIEVGGQGRSFGTLGGSAGYNGGGAGGSGGSNEGAGGGGASDVRQGGGALANRKVVAGGGAGGGSGVVGTAYRSAGGDGGDLVGQNGKPVSSATNYGRGGTQSAGGAVSSAAGPLQPTVGALGVGGNGGWSGTAVFYGGGGGGGYYGGGGGGFFSTLYTYGGGGGSSYAGAGTSVVSHNQGAQYGDGAVSILPRTKISDVQYAQINADGTLGTWASTSSFTTARSMHSSVAYNGYVYVLGGALGDGTALNDVQYAPINSNGTLGTWASTSSFTTARSMHSSVAYNGYVYVIGNSGGLNTMEIQYAPLNPDGTVGTWARTTNFSPPVNGSTGLIGATVVASNGFMYVLGGAWNSTYSNNVQYAPINANGTLGNWNGTTQLGVTRAGLGGQMSAVYNGYVYMTGGLKSSTASDTTNTTEYAGLNSIPRKTSYSKTIDFGMPSSIRSLAYTGRVPGGMSNINYRLADNNGVFGATKNGATFSCAGSGPGRYMQILVTLDDSQMGAFRDDLSTNSAMLDSLTINTTPMVAPNDKRLRHGAFFSDQVLQPFNTNSVQCGS